MAIGKIEAVDVVGERRIAIRWDDGVIRIVDLSAPISERSVLAPLRTADEFERVQVSADGWSLEWPRGVDFGAPQLRRWADEQAAQAPADPVSA